MIFKVIAYRDEFHEEQNRPYAEMRCDETEVPEILESFLDFLQDIGYDMQEDGEE